MLYLKKKKKNIKLHFLSIFASLSPICIGENLNLKEFLNPGGYAQPN